MTAELSIQFADDESWQRFKVVGIDARFDPEHWKEMKWMTPNSAGGRVAPSVEWVFISDEGTISLEPIADATGRRICDIPAFVRAEIYPVHFGYPSRLEDDYPKESEEYFRELTRRAAAAGEAAPVRNNVFRFALNEELWRRYHTAEEEKRWLQSLSGIGLKLATCCYYQRGVFEQDRKRIRFRADFYARGTTEPASVLCGRCQERVTSVTEANLLPVRPPELAIEFETLVADLHCKPVTLRAYCDALGIDWNKPFTPVQAAQIKHHRRNLRRRQHLKVQNRTRHGHPAKLRSIQET